MIKSNIQRGRTASAICAAACVALCLLYPNTVLQAAKASFDIFINSLLPALFPCFVFTSVLVKTDVLTAVGRRIAPLFARLGLPGEAGPIFLLGGLSGYPVGAKLTASLEDRTSLPVLERICAASNMASPMFLTGTVATALLGAPELGWTLLLSHWVGALVVLLLPVGRDAAAPMSAAVPDKPFSLIDSVLSGISEGMNSMLRVCGSLILFAVISSLFRMFLPLETGSLPSALITGFFEKSAGCSAISVLALPLNLRAALCSFLVAFGGCSVLLQTLFFSRVRVSRYWGLKLVQAAVAAIITFVLVG